MSPQSPPFWKDDKGFVITSELTLISTVVVLSMVTTLSGLTTSITDEIARMGSPPDTSNQNDRYAGIISTLPNVPDDQAPPPASSGSEQ